MRDLGLTILQVANPAVGRPSSSLIEDSFYSQGGRPTVGLDTCKIVNPQYLKKIHELLGRPTVGLAACKIVNRQSLTKCLPPGKDTVLRMPISEELLPNSSPPDGNSSYSEECPHQLPTLTYFTFKTPVHALQYGNSYRVIPKIFYIIFCLNCVLKA